MNWTIHHNPQNAKVTFSERKSNEKNEKVIYLDIIVDYGCEVVPQPLSVKTVLDCVDTLETWSQNHCYARPLGVNWNKQTTTSRLSSGAPLHTLVSAGGQNRLTIALSDALTPMTIRTGIIEESAENEILLTFFTLPQTPIAFYRVTVRLDFTERRYEDSIRAAEQWWSTRCGYANAPVPATAKMPMYSTWYSFHQHTNSDEIIEQCRLAKEYGMEAVILDDGWQTANEARGYSYCGDWEVAKDKIPDMRTFVDAVHQIGMKFIVWYSVPFVGKHSRAFARFEDMFLKVEKNFGEKAVGVLDPRYPEVRRYLVSLYRTAVVEWDLDGLKLDFIDSFQLPNEEQKEDSRRDTQALEDAIVKLLDEITAELRAVKPDIMIEFRQTYVGPAIRKYGNMMRVGDCPLDPIVNRRASVGLRLCCGESAVHSDMLMWSKNDSAESVAAQLQCCLFAVPQISVRLDEIPAEHRKVLAFWLEFWRARRDVLMNGLIYAEHPEANYTLVTAEKDGTIVAVNYAECILSVNQQKRIYYVNGSPSDRIVLRAEADIGEMNYTIYCCTGEISESGKQELKRGLYDFAVPRSGMIVIER